MRQQARFVKRHEDYPPLCLGTDYRIIVREGVLTDWDFRPKFDGYTEKKVRSRNMLVIHAAWCGAQLRGFWCAHLERQ